MRAAIVPLPFCTVLLLTLLEGCATSPAPGTDAASTVAQPALAPSPPPSPSPSATPPTEPPTELTDEIIESTRRMVRATTEWLARGVDGWFGDKPFEQGGSVTHGRFSISVLKRQDANTDVAVRLNARFQLPNIEEKTYLFVGRDDPREVVTDQPGPLTRRERMSSAPAADQAFFAGFGRAFDERTDFRLGFRGGLKPYGQGRFRQPWQPQPEDLVEFRQTLFWSLDDHLGSTTALSYEHAFAPALVGRWLNAVTITQVSKKFEWTSSLGSYWSLGHERLLSLELLATARQGSGVGLTDYGVQARWEQPVHRRGLVGEVLIGHFWPRPDATSARGRAWAMGGGLKIRF